MSKVPKKIWMGVDKSDGDVELYMSAKGNGLGYVREDLVDRAIMTLTAAGTVFQRYAKHHEAKGDVEKASLNTDFAELMQATIDLLEEEDRDE